jgi:hypothetical protein
MILPSRSPQQRDRGALSCRETDGSARVLAGVSVVSCAAALARNHYIQMYSSAMAPSRHFATVTIRLPSSSSPTTQVQSPDPNRTG